MALRIAMVIDPWRLPFNGTVVSTRRFAFALAKAGCHVRLLHIGGQAGEPAMPGIDHVEFQKLSIPSVDRLIDSMRAPLAQPDRRRIRMALHGVNILHVQFPFFLGHAAIAQAGHMGIPVVCSFHIQPENILSNLGLSNRWMRELLYRFFVARFYARADRVIAPSEFAAETLRAHGVKRPVTVISNGVPDEFLNIPSMRVQSRDGDPQRPFKVLSVGRLAAEKRHDVLLQAVTRSRYAPRIQLTLAGTGPREHALIEQARALGVQAHIGPVPQDALLALYRDADLFVHCGLIELEGMSVIEAMAAGLTVIVANSDESACPRLVATDWSRFEPDNPDHLVRSIDHWLSDPAARDREGIANHHYASSLAHEHSVARLLTVYREVLGVR